MALPWTHSNSSTFLLYLGTSGLDTVLHMESHISPCVWVAASAWLLELEVTMLVSIGCHTLTWMKLVKWLQKLTMQHASSDCIGTCSWSTRSQCRCKTQSLQLVLRMCPWENPCRKWHLFFNDTRKATRINSKMRFKILQCMSIINTITVTSWVILEVTILNVPTVHHFKDTEHYFPQELWFPRSCQAWLSQVKVTNGWFGHPLL